MIPHMAGPGSPRQRSLPSSKIASEDKLSGSGQATARGHMAGGLGFETNRVRVRMPKLWRSRLRQWIWFKPQNGITVTNR